MLVFVTEQIPTECESENARLLLAPYRAIPAPPNVSDVLQRIHRNPLLTSGAARQRAREQVHAIVESLPRARRIGKVTEKEYTPKKDACTNAQHQTKSAQLQLR